MTDNLPSGNALPGSQVAVVEVLKSTEVLSRVMPMPLIRGHVMTVEDG